MYHDTLSLVKRYWDICYGARMTQIEPFPARVKRLAAERKLSVAQVGQEAADYNVRGTTVSTLNKAMRGKRHPGRRLVENIAQVLEVDPWEFPEYRLATLRAALDEREVGLDQAVANILRLTKRQKPGALRDALERELAEHLQQADEPGEAAG